MHAHVTSSPCTCGGERKAALVSLLIRTLILSEQGPTLMTSPNLNQFLVPNTSLWG